MSMKNSSETIGNRTRDLTACSALLQPTAPPRAPSDNFTRTNNNNSNNNNNNNKKKKELQIYRFQLFTTFSIVADYHRRFGVEWHLHRQG
jgi:hypothetical protein